VFGGDSMGGRKQKYCWFKETEQFADTSFLTKLKQINYHLWSDGPEESLLLSQR